MKDERSVFVTIEDEVLAALIREAKRRVMYVAPGVGIESAHALTAVAQQSRIPVTVVVDVNPEACKLGFGDPDGLHRVAELATESTCSLRRHSGVRIGAVIVDDEAIVWAPTVRFLEPERVENQRNGLRLRGTAVDDIAKAIGVNVGLINGEPPEVGQAVLTPAEVNLTLAELELNPPASFDLTRLSRVFSSKYRFVELEVRGLEWTERRMRLSSILLNSDLPESLQEMLETKVRPFQTMENDAFPVPASIQGRPAFERDGSPLLVPMTQDEVSGLWTEIRKRYLLRLKRFGWLIRQDRLADFHAEVDHFELILREWIGRFKVEVERRTDLLVEQLATAIQSRLTRSSQRQRMDPLVLRHEVRRGFSRLLDIEPSVQTYLKDIAWESSRDTEFLAALREVLPRNEREGWFEEFTAVLERRDTKL